MSISRDKRIVEMELNNRNFEANAKASINTIDKLKVALRLDNAEDGFYRVEKAASTINLQPIVNSLDEIKSKFSAVGIFGVETMRRITNAALDAGEKMWATTFGQIKSGGSQRALNIANSQFKLEGLGIAWKEASKDINQAVDGTAYSFDAAANTAAQLATAGIQLGESYGGMAHSLRAVSGIAAMTNSSYEEIGYIFSQIASAGRLMGQDAMQISQRGINVTATLAKQFGKTTAEIQEMQRKGDISFAMFAEAMNDAFGDQATKANNTFQGALSNVKAALSRIGEIWYGPFYNAAITPLNKIRVAINQIKKAFDDGDESTRDFKDRLTELMNIVSNIFSWLTENTDLMFFINIAEGANKVLDALNGIGHAIEKNLGIFKTDKAVSETEKLKSSVESLTEAELEAAKAIWETGKYGNGQERIDNLLAAGFTEEGARRIQGAIDKFIESNYTWAEAEKAVVEETREAKEETETLSQAITSKFVRSFTYARRTVSILADSFGNVASGVWNIIKIVGESFVKVFNFDIVAHDILELAYRVRYITELFRNWTNGNEKLRNIFDEVFKVANSFYRVIRSVASIILTLFSSLVTVLNDVVKDFDLGEVSISKFTDKIALWSENLALIVKQSKIFIKIFRTIVEFARKLINYAKQIPDKLQPFFDKTNKNVDTLLKKFKELTGIDVVSGIKKASDIIRNFFSILSDPFSKNADGKTAISAWAEAAKNSILSVFGNPDSLFVKIKEWFQKGFAKIKNNPEEVASNDVFSSIVNVLANVIKFLDDLDVAKAIRNILAVGVVITTLVATLKIIKLVNTLQKPAESIKNLVGKVIGFITNLNTLSKRVARAIEIDLMANAFIKFASGLAIMAASIVALGLIDTNILIKGLTALAFCIIGLAGSMVLYNKTVDANAIKLFDTTLLQFGVSLGIMAAIVIKMGRMKYESLAKGLIMLNILALIYDQLIVVNRIFRGGKNDIWKGILALAVAMDLMIPVVKVIGEMRALNAIKGIIAMDLIFKELGAMTVAAAFLSEKFDSLDILGIVGSMSLLSIAINATIPFLELIGRMSFADFVQGILGFGGVLAAIAGVLVGASKILAGTDIIDVAVIAASIGIITLASNMLLPSIATLGAMEKIQEGSVFEIISSLMTIIVGIGALLTLMSMITVGSNVALIAFSMVGVIAALNMAIPGLLSLAVIPIDSLMNVVGALSVLGLVFTTLISILAVVNIATGESVVAILAALGVMLGEIAFTIIAGSVALGFAAVQLGRAILNISIAADTFSKIDGDKIIENSEKFLDALQILAIGLASVAPKISTSIKSITSGITSGVVIGVIEAISENLPKLSTMFNKIVFYLVNTITSNMLLVIVGLITSIVNALTVFLEWITDESGGKSILERIGHALVDAFIIVLDVLTERVEEIATWIVDFFIAVVKAATMVLNTRGDEFNKAWAEFMDSLGVYILSASETLKEHMMRVGGKILSYIWDGVIEKWKEVKRDISNGVKEVERSVKEFFGINDGDGSGSIFYKIGKKNIELLGEGIKNAWNGGKDILSWFSTEIGSFVGEMFRDLTNSVEKKKEETGSVIGKKFGDILGKALHEGMGINSPSTEMWEAGKNLLLGLVNGVKDNLGLSEFSLSGLFEDLKDSIVGGNNNGGSFFDDLLGNLGIDDNNTFEITPVLDTSAFDKDYSNFASDIGLDTNYNFGTSSGLASDIGYSTAGGISSSGFTPESVNGLRSDVQDIAERIGRLEVRMDTGALVGALYAGIDEKLGEKQILAGRGVYA